MLIYVDAISRSEIGSDAFEHSPVDGFSGVRQVQSKKIVFQEVEVNTGGNASAGGGEADEDGDADEGVDAEEAKSVIDIVHSFKLQKIDLSAKEFASMTKSYWKQLIAALNKERYINLGISVSEDDDKDAIKEKEAAAYAELSAFEKKSVDASKARMEKFKANFASLQAFVKDYVVGNFKEFEFYMGEEAELGEGVIIPARYIGEAEAPIFYFFEDGLNFLKA